MLRVNLYFTSSPRRLTMSRKSIWLGSIAGIGLLTASLALLVARERFLPGPIAPHVEDLTEIPEVQLQAPKSPNSITVETINCMNAAAMDHAVHALQKQHRDLAGLPF